MTTIEHIASAGVLILGVFCLLILMSVAAHTIYHDYQEAKAEDRLRQLAEDLDVRETRRHLEVIADALAAPGNAYLDSEESLPRVPGSVVDDVVERLQRVANGEAA